MNKTVNVIFPSPFKNKINKEEDEEEETELDQQKQAFLDEKFGRHTKWTGHVEKEDVRTTRQA